MNNVVTDLDQRRQVISAEGSFIVRAPAGSGKTELLIQRFLHLLSLVDAPEEIVAITFTRKAAAEMQTRILKALGSARNETEPEAAHARQTWQLAQAALKRASQLDWQLEQIPARLKIQTIDSLCATLTRQMPLLSGLGAQPETVEDATPLYEQAAINTLSELESDAHWSDSIARLLIHLDNDLPRIKQLIMNMLGKRDQWLRHVVPDLQREELESALQHVIREKLAQLRDLMPAEHETALCETAAFAALNLKESSPDHPLTHCSFITEYPGTEVEDLPFWQGLCELLLTTNGQWRQKLTIRNGFPPASSAAKAEKQIRSRMKQQIESLIQQLEGIPGLSLALDDIRRLPPVRYTDEEWDVVGALCNLLMLAEGQLRLLFAGSNRTDFAGIAHAAIQALGTDDAPTDLVLSLDYRIKHLLVDEYQDISVNQSRLLQGLTAGWSGDDGHSLFLVGDPMQSIYRFREAEVGIFLDTWKNRQLGQVHLEPVTLRTNFRSQPGLVEWVNSTFAQLMPAVEDVNTGAVSFETSVAFHNVQPLQSVTVHPSLTSSGVAEADNLVRQVVEIKNVEPEESIAVLVRSRRHLLD
ncbi:MAG: UvrD-helicase domain-containing protein, partial [Gammaproteobacteria bacterium]|nr:UvrD-helicase domain-containing protein [Gammaproteobacteria bacterium]